MTINEAINRLDNLKCNTYSRGDKLEWLSRLDGLLFRQVISQHEGAEEKTFSGYTEDTDVDTKLLAEPPFDDLYLRWMEAQIDYHNGEYDRYNAAILLFNTALETYSNDYRMRHMPKSYGSRFRF